MYEKDLSVKSGISNSEQKTGSSHYNPETLSPPPIMLSFSSNVTPPDPRLKQQENEIDYLVKNISDILVKTDNSRVVRNCFHRLELARSISDETRRFLECEEILETLNISILIAIIQINEENGTPGVLQCGNQHLTRLPGKFFTHSRYQMYWEMLWVLILDDNRLKSLPPEIGLLKALKVLYLNNNQLQTLPPEIAQLQRLETFQINGNQLQGPLSELAQLSRLQMLYLNNNPLQNLSENIEDSILRDKNYEPTTKAQVLASHTSPRFR